MPRLLGDDENDDMGLDEDLQSYTVEYLDRSTGRVRIVEEDIEATDLDDAWDWAEAYADGREIRRVSTSKRRL